MKAVCISHGEDVDGLVCAAILQHLKGALPILVDYDDFTYELKKIDPSVDEIYICDLGVREAVYEEIVRVRKFASVTLVDHHSASEEILEKLRRSGIPVVYSTLDCASILLYNYFKDKLGKKAARLAVYAAISDQFEKGPIASKLLSKFDKHLTWHEALILTHALEHQNKDKIKLLLVKQLNSFRFPHEIRGVAEMALASLDVMAKLTNTLPVRASRLRRIAYVECVDENSIRTFANLLLDSMNIDLGLGYKRKGVKTINISIRGRANLKIHLGMITKRLAERCGGFGGGHKNASGAKVPEENFMNFIHALEEELEK